MTRTRNVVEDLGTLEMLRNELERQQPGAGQTPADVVLRSAVHYLVNRAIEEDERIIRDAAMVAPDDD